LAALDAAALGAAVLDADATAHNTATGADLAPAADAQRVRLPSNVTAAAKNITIVTTTTTTTTTTRTALIATDAATATAAAVATSAIVGGTPATQIVIGPAHTATRHPYIVVAIHGFWSFVLFLLNFVTIVVVGVATFWLKGVHRLSEDSQLVIGARFQKRRSLLRGMWRDAFARVRELRTQSTEPSVRRRTSITAVALSQLRVEVDGRPRMGSSPYAGSSAWQSVASIGGSGRSSVVSPSSDVTGTPQSGEQGRSGYRGGLAKLKGSAMDIL